MKSALVRRLMADLSAVLWRTCPPFCGGVSVFQFQKKYYYLGSPKKIYRRCHVWCHLLMSKYKNIFRIESARLKNWDYSNPWWYYVTINTKNHINHFGKIETGKMKLNELGKIVEEYWIQIPKHFKMADIDCFIIMPNHLHGIVETGYIPSQDELFETPDRASLQLWAVFGKFKALFKRTVSINIIAFG
jgi:REP element-mobilizing transposase RayT